MGMGTDVRNNWSKSEKTTSSQIKHRKKMSIWSTRNKKVRKSGSQRQKTALLFVSKESQYPRELSQEENKQIHKKTTISQIKRSEL